MCQKTPLVGETWVFRREAPVEHYEAETGRVTSVDEWGFYLKKPNAGGAPGEHLMGLPITGGWEPFLCLSEGETQEHPTSYRDRMIRLHLDMTAPRVGERWHFRSTGEGTFVWNGMIVGVGDDWWVGKTPHGPELLWAAAWKPVRQVAG